jgi:hypothetical protein
MTLLSSYFSNLIKSAIELRIKLFLYKHNVHEAPPLTQLTCAIKHNNEVDLQVLEWLKSHYNFDDSPENEIEKYRWKYGKYNDGKMINPKIINFRYAAGIGDLQVLEWLTSNFTYSTENITCSLCWALQTADLKTLKWVHNKFNISAKEIFDYHGLAFFRGTFNVFELAAGNGKLDILWWLQATFNVMENTPRSSIVTAFHYAVIKGQLKVAKWIYYMLDITRKEAANNGNELFCIIARNSSSSLKVLKWLHSTFNFSIEEIFPLRVQCHGEAFVNAAAANHLDILQWLCDTFKMQDKHLRKNFLRHILRAFSEACEHNHLEVLKWLHSTFKLGKKEAGHMFHNAIIYGDLETLSWFKTTFKITKKDMFALLIVTTQLEVLEWLCSTFKITKKDKGKDGRNYCGSIFFHAATYGQLEVLKWLYFKFNLTKKDIESFNILPSLEISDVDNYFDVIDWLQDTFEIDTFCLTVSDEFLH